MDKLDQFMMEYFDMKELDQFEKIYCLVSGGIDSTLLYHVLKNRFGTKLFPVNCYNPFEVNASLLEIQKDPNFMEIKPDSKFDYAAILKESFLRLPFALYKRVLGQYGKKIFGCCYYIKHKAFFNNPIFVQPGTVIISGIKDGDGYNRHSWLEQMRQKKAFIHKHLTGQMYCYPFRDYNKRELPEEIVTELKTFYPTVSHSGCAICPVLVLFKLDFESRYEKSLLYAQNLLGENADILQFCKQKLGKNQKAHIKAFLESNKKDLLEIKEP